MAQYNFFPFLFSSDSQRKLDRFLINATFYLIFFVSPQSLTFFSTQFLLHFSYNLDQNAETYKISPFHFFSFNFVSSKKMGRSFFSCTYLFYFPVLFLHCLPFLNYPFSFFFFFHIIFSISLSVSPDLPQCLFFFSP